MLTSPADTSLGTAQGTVAASNVTRGLKSHATNLRYFQFWLWTSSWVQYATDILTAPVTADTSRHNLGLEKGSEEGFWVHLKSTIKTGRKNNCNRNERWETSQTCWASQKQKQLMRYKPNPSRQCFSRSYPEWAAKHLPKASAQPHTREGRACSLAGAQVSKTPSHDEKYSSESTVAPF